ncbi:hypothetical protein SDC9_56190 [bioreactor metagenome]|uniref:Uncharacterized protein n=1 Tax=bioreactor metagenome TaxID=1076179 RepID=A0A644X1N8_9ZZZZ
MISVFQIRFRVAYFFSKGKLSVLVFGPTVVQLLAGILQLLLVIGELRICVIQFCFGFLQCVSCVVEFIPAAVQLASPILKLPPAVVKFSPGILQLGVARLQLLRSLHKILLALLVLIPSGFNRFLAPMKGILRTRQLVPAGAECRRHGQISHHIGEISV